MESNLLLEQYSWYKKQQLAKAPFECLLNANIEPNPHQVNAFCAAIQALKTGGIILADEVGLGKTIEAGLVLNYVLDNGAKKGTDISSSYFEKAMGSRTFRKVWASSCHSGSIHG